MAVARDTSWGIVLDRSGQLRAYSLVRRLDHHSGMEFGAELGICATWMWISDLALVAVGYSRQYIHERFKHDQCCFYRYLVHRTSLSHQTSIRPLLRKNLSFNLPKALYQNPRAAQLSTEPAATCASSILVAQVIPDQLVASPAVALAVL